MSSSELILCLCLYKLISLYLESTYTHNEFSKLIDHISITKNEMDPVAC